ncbi:acid-sensing ion channel 2-like [Haliotis rubra]|uniref:acid-sensing ion channel 2-like n=1 Tax=Haliotis rubra TaxID=36100 RepID=UPI001EE5961D|nr:acid-sensing ion channel 2-like [Haliotis rubra]
MMALPKTRSEKNGIPEAFVYRGEEEMKSGNVKEQFNKFFQETSFTALVRIYNATSIVKRLAWLVVFLAMLAWLSVQCYWLLERYFNYPVEVKMDLVAAQELDFPSITVCNLNPLKKSKLHEMPYRDLASFMQLESQDKLYTAFKDNYYDDWYEDKHRKPDAVIGMPMTTWMSNPNTFGLVSSTSWGTNGNGVPNPTTESPPGVATSAPSATSGQVTGPLVSQPSTNSSGQATNSTSDSMGVGLDTTTKSGDPAPFGSSQTASSSSTTHDSGATDSTSGMTGGVPLTTMGGVGGGVGGGGPTPKKRKKRQAADLTDFLKENSFNKWDMLERSNVANEFYEDKDREYIASMAYATFSKTHNASTLIEGGHPAKNFIIDCKMEGFPCSPKNFTTFVSHKYGNCYTFNAEGNGKKVVSRFTGPSHGLSLELYLDQDEYIAALSPSAGARVLIHPRNSMPFPEDEGISIAPGVSTSVGLRKVDITRLTPPHGVCAEMGLVEDFYNTNLHTNYSKLSCLKSCYQNLVIKYCHCAMPGLYVPANITVCNMTNTTVETCSTELPDTQKAEFQQCDKSCPQPCREVRFEKTLSAAQWPSKQYKHHLQSKVQQSNYKFYGSQVEEEDFARVEVYFEDLLFKEIEQQKAYESQNLISDIGGQLGLWLGLSAITLGELFSFLFSIGQAATRRVVGNSKKGSKTPIEPVSYM